MNAYDSLLKHGKAQLNVNQNGEELVCFYPHMLKKALSQQLDVIAQLKKQKEHWENQYILENEKWKLAEKSFSDVLIKMANNTKGELANANLVLAAPELLEASNDLLNACYKASMHDELSEIIDGKLMDAVQFAIAKARGEA